MVVLLAVLTILACITVDLLIRRAERLRAAESLGLRKTEQVLPSLAAVEPPGGLFFHGGHTWAKLEPSGDLQVGLDGFAREILGRVDRFELPAQGIRLHQGEPAFAALQDGKRIEFVSPVDGVVCAVNPGINDDPDGTKAEPYDKGWAFAIRPSDFIRNLDRTLGAPRRGASELVLFTEKPPGPESARMLRGLRDHCTGDGRVLAPRVLLTVRAGDDLVALVDECAAGLSTLPPGAGPAGASPAITRSTRARSGFLADSSSCTRRARTAEAGGPASTISREPARSSSATTSMTSSATCAPTASPARRTTAPSTRRSREAAYTPPATRCSGARTAPASPSST